jgi:hypothetical protein
LLALSVGEAGKELVFGIALALRGTIELPFAGGGESHDVAAAVCGVAFAYKVANGFEGVEQRDEDARIDVDEDAELALRDPATVVQKAEQVKLPRRELFRCVGGSEAPHSLLAEQREEQSRAGCALLE